jgi:uncharacterized protein YndB with AHSA1/START domain
MNRNLTARSTVTIEAPPSKVWEALTSPRLMKQYFFGAEVVSDWKEGSPIVFRGVWEGKPYEDKGMIKKMEPGRKLVATHWSPLSGVPDAPENYHTVTYELTPRDGGTQVTLTQDNNASEEEQRHSEKNWDMVLQGLKNVLENRSA